MGYKLRAERIILQDRYLIDELKRNIGILRDEHNDIYVRNKKNGKLIEVEINKINKKVDMYEEKIKILKQRNIK